MSTRKLLSKRDIFFGVEAASKSELFAFVAERAAEFGVTDEPDALAADLMAREEQFTTGLMDGFAIPHTKSSNVKKVEVFFIRSKNPIPWEAMDEEPAQCFFVLLVPIENDGNIHLRMISELATCLLEDEFRDEVRMVADPVELVSYINEAIQIREEEK